MRGLIVQGDELRTEDETGPSFLCMKPGETGCFFNCNPLSKVLLGRILIQAPRAVSFVQNDLESDTTHVHACADIVPLQNRDISGGWKLGCGCKRRGHIHVSIRW
jgi:hypothetical protein